MSTPSSGLAPTRPPAAGMVWPPPSYPAVSVLVGLALHWWRPLPLPRDASTAVIAAVSLVAAVLLLQGSWRTFRRVRTPLEPWKASKVLVTDGVFRLSRNPVYVAFLLVQVAIGWWSGNGWILALTPLTWLLLDRLQVRREERYLLERFGDEYRDYLQRVRRWI